MDKYEDIIYNSELELTNQFKSIQDICYYNSKKVLDAFHQENISESDFFGSTGYGYGDVGREKIENIFAKVLNKESSLVRSQIISGTHALTIALFAVLRPGDTLLSITGKPYDTLHEVIGITNNNSSLKSFGVEYQEIDLIDNDFNYNAIKEVIENKKIKVIHIQRSRGYSLRNSLSVELVNKVYEFIKKIDNDIIILVDNCYCEFVTKEEPNSDLLVGSLIKNLGGGIALNGGYIAGKKEYVHLASERLNVPGEAKDVGPSFNMNRLLLQGIYNAPKVVTESMKVALLTRKALSKLGYQVLPSGDDLQTDIVQSIIFNDKEKLIKFVQGIQKGSAIDSAALVMPQNMPGYDDEIIMASGSFIQGSSIEISCDGPLRKPYVAYMQGSITYEYGKLALLTAIKYFL